MNIFIVNENPVIAAQELCDRHVVKMVVETAQILCTVSAEYDIMAPYRPTHKHHPCVVWAGETSDNYQWTLAHLIALSDEYTTRYGRVHKTAGHIPWLLSSGGRPTQAGTTPFVQCMPEELRGPDTVVAYQNYYRKRKAHFATWTKRDVPVWFHKEGVSQ